MKNTKKLLSLLLVVAMIFSLAVPVFAEGETETPATLASWVGGTSLKNNGDADVLSDVELTVGAVSSGANLKNHAVKTSTFGNLSATPWYGENNYAAGTQYAYVAFQLSTKGYENLSIATVLGGNARVPLAYKLMYSLDNETWTDVEGAITTAAAVNKLESAVKSTVAVPAAAADQETVYFRIAQTAAAAPNDKGSGTDAGNLYIFSIALTGTAKSATPDPEPGELDGKTVILHSNDVHGAISGYANMAGLAAEYKAKGAEVILADAGDYSQGAVSVSSNKGLNAVTLMNKAGYDVATLGNHEFDYGYEQLTKNLKAADFENICCNIVGADGKKLFEGSTVITTESGLKIGFIGVNTPETSTKANPALIKGLSWLSGDKMIEAVNAEAAALEGKADVVIVLAHLGVDEESAPNRSTDLLAGVKGVDFIIDGHSHTVMPATAAEPIQSTGTKFEYIGVVVIDNKTKAIESNELVKVTAETASDAAVAAAVKEINDKIDAEYGEVFAKSEVALNGERAYSEETKLYGNRDGETNLGDLITDAMLWKINEQGGVTVDADHILAVTNGGGIRASIAAGDITKKAVNEVLPFGNTLAVVYVTGAELLEALEASTYCSPDSAVGGFPQVAGIEYTIDVTKEFDGGDKYPGTEVVAPKSIQRVTIDSINGKAFDAKATYAVVTNNFVAAGGDTYHVFAAAAAQFDTGFSLDEVVMEYIKTELKGVVGEQYKDPQGRINYAYEPFSDIEGWFHDYIIVAAAAGLVNGFPDGTFRPDENVTREQYITMLYRLFDTDEDKEGAELTFTDAGTIGYGKEAVSWGVANGVINGYTDNTFRPNAKITRAEMAAMTYRALCSVIGKEAADSHNVDAGFKDVVSGSYYETPVNVLAHMGIINGMGEGVYAPDGVATRAQAAKILASILVYFG